MKRGIHKEILFLAVTIISIFTSCSRNIVYTDSAVMQDNTWSLSAIPEFNVEVKDTLLSTNVYFTIRTGSDYPFRNIWLFVTAISPDRKSITDTIQYNLADEKGNWYGKGFGDIHELDLPYRTNVFFPVRGTYQFKIQHGMRIGDLKGVYDFGLRIEKSSR
jgi:gliding motility-associated lipoprotein GldH